MSIAGHIAVAMLNIHHVAITAAVPAGISHNAISSCHNRRAAIIGNINARMIVGATPPKPIRGAYIATGRPYRRCRGIDTLLISNQLLLLFHGLTKLLNAGLSG